MRADTQSDLEATPDKPQIVVETVNNRELSIFGPDDFGVYDLVLASEDGDEYAWLTAEALGKIGAWINEQAI